MTDDTTRRRGRQEPQDFLPDIPFGINPALANLLAEMRQQLQVLAVDPAPPAQVTGLALTAVYPGILVQWNRAAKAGSYRIFRNTTSNLTTATPITELAGIGNVSFFDITSNLGTTAVYYWVQAINGLGIPGPVSIMGALQNSEPTNPDGNIAILGLDGSMQAIAYPDDDLPSLLAMVSLPVGADASSNPNFWPSVTDDEDLVCSTGLSAGGYTIP